MKPGDALLVLEMESLGKAYEVIQGLANAVEAVEMIPGATGAVVMIAGNETALKGLQGHAGITRQRLVPSLSEAVVQAYLGLENPPLDGNFFCFESPDLGEVFEVADTLAQKGFAPFDLRILRGGPWKAYVLATGRGGTESLAGFPWLVRLTHIPSPSASLRDYFSLKPH
ncbi:MAG: hypothetical protein KF802_09780 [Bdellovibrionaceae bacterium]|nr:hypothetical protein [Pseudobdellovibrionaceae bacterium]